MSQKEFLDQQETSDYLKSLGIEKAPRTLANLRVKGGGIPFVKHGGRILYRRSEVDAWVRSLKSVQSTSELAA